MTSGRSIKDMTWYKTNKSKLKQTPFRFDFHPLENQTVSFLVAINVFWFVGIIKNIIYAY